MAAKRPKNRTPITTTLRERYMPTTDDWHPNFPRDTVLVRLIEYTAPSKDDQHMLRATVRGMDDTVMEMDIRVPANELDATRTSLLHLVDHELPNPLTRAWLATRGFGPG